MQEDKYTYELSKDEIHSVIEFANNMVEQKATRGNQTGGDLERTDEQIRADQIRGKIGEFVVYHYFISQEVKPESTPDLNIYPRGEYDDSYDIIVKSKQGNRLMLQVKSAKSFARNLLINANDWKASDSQLIYIGNTDKYNDKVPSFFLAVNTQYNDMHSGSDAFSGSIEGYLPKKAVIDGIQSNERYHKKGSPIPNITNTIPLDANNYIWSLKELWDISYLIHLFK